MCEKNIWKTFTFFQSADYTQNFLKKCYSQLQFNDLDVKSYENSYTFMYYLEHAEIYYNQSKKSPLAIQPVLMFYGLIHLIKACLLTVDPSYPETTSVMAHGVSSRKRKKQNFQFLHDEVKIQKLGLCTHFANKMFQLNYLEGEKFLMIHLLKQLPELNDCFSYLDHIDPFLFLDQKNGQFTLPISILDHYHMTAERFANYINQKSSGIIEEVQSSKDCIHFTSKKILPLPFRFHLYNNQYCLPNKLSKEMFLPELIIHYLLLYNLSMIARYETEWWAELLKTRQTYDYPIIQSFIEQTMNKAPYICFEFLNAKIHNEC